MDEFVNIKNNFILKIEEIKKERKLFAQDFFNKIIEKIGKFENYNDLLEEILSVENSKTFTIIDSGLNYGYISWLYALKKECKNLDGKELEKINKTYLFQMSTEEFGAINNNNPVNRYNFPFIGGVITENELKNLRKLKNNFKKIDFGENGIIFSLDELLEEINKYKKEISDEKLKILREYKILDYNQISGYGNFVSCGKFGLGKVIEKFYDFDFENSEESSLY